VLYHLPRGTWEEVLTQLAGRLAPSAALVVSLKAPESWSFSAPGGLKRAVLIQIKRQGSQSQDTEWVTT
jgi:hypothetical protein